MSHSARGYRQQTSPDKDFTDLSSPYDIADELDNWMNGYDEDDLHVEWAWNPDTMTGEMESQATNPETADYEWVRENIFEPLENSRRSYFSRSRRVKDEGDELVFRVEYGEIPEDNSNYLREEHLTDENGAAMDPEKVGLNSQQSTIDFMRQPGELELRFRLE